MFQVLSGKQSMGRLYFFIHFNLLNAESNLFALIVITDMVGFVTFFYCVLSFYSSFLSLFFFLLLGRISISSSLI